MRTTIITVALIVGLTSQTFAQATVDTTPPFTPDATNCGKVGTPMEAQAVFGATLVLAFCSAEAFDLYTTWIDGEVITLDTPASTLMKSPIASATDQVREYITPIITKSLTVGRHWFSVITKNSATGVETMPSKPVSLLITPAPPPADCAGQVVLTVGEVRPRVALPGGAMEVTFSLRQSKVPVTNLEVRVNGTAVEGGLPVTSDLRAVGMMRFAAPTALGNYTVSVIAFGNNGCSDGVDRYLPFSVTATGK